MTMAKCGILLKCLILHILLTSSQSQSRWTTNYILRHAYVGKNNLKLVITLGGIEIEVEIGIETGIVTGVSQKMISVRMMMCQLRVSHKKLLVNRSSRVYLFIIKSFPMSRDEVTTTDLDQKGSVRRLYATET